MLKDEDRIFKNLYNDNSSDLESLQLKEEIGKMLKKFFLKEKNG